MTSAVISSSRFALQESARKKTAPWKVDLYDAFCAVLYLLRTGCQWRAHGVHSQRGDLAHDTLESLARPGLEP